MTGEFNSCEAKTGPASSSDWHLYINSSGNDLNCTVIKNVICSSVFLDFCGKASM